MTEVGVASLFSADQGIDHPGPPVVESAYSIDEHTIRITFDRGMKSVNPAESDDALNPANYTYSVFGGAMISSVSVSVVGSTGNKQFEIVTTSQTSGALYTVYANTNIKSESLEEVSADRNSAEFTGFGERPGVESATADSATQVTVIFTELMDHNAALETPGNYDISGPTTVTVTSVVATDEPSGKTHAVCQLSGEMITNDIYTMEVTNVADAAYNPILGNPDNQATFLGIGDHPRVNGTATPIAGGLSCKIVYSELMAASVLNTSYYTLEGPPGTFLNVTNVENVDDDYTYKLTTEQQTAGVLYTVTVSTDVKDLVGNEVLPPYNQATFTGAGYSPPEITMNPEDQSTDVNIRRKLLITAKDPTEEFTGINMSTWWTRLTFSRGVDYPDTVQYAIKDGEIQPGYEGGVAHGDPDEEEGVTMWVRPLVGKWFESTQYQVETYVEDNEAIPNENLVVGWFRTKESVCFEDNLPTAAATDTLLSTTMTDYPNCEKLRRVIMENSTMSSSSLVRARTLMHLACITDLKTMLAGHFDYALVDDIRLCDRLPVLELYRKLVKYPTIIRNAIAEIPQLTNESRAAILQQLKSNSAIYVVNAVALTVLLCALLSEE
jgi:hypothetical protein